MNLIMLTPKKIIFYHYCFAIPAEVWLLPEKNPDQITLKQVIALDLPREMKFSVIDRRILHFPDVFHKHVDTLKSIVESIRNLGVIISVRLEKKVQGLNGG
jgi:hypothetical protein